MKHALRIVVFTIFVTAFYTYIGQMVPQKVTYPPQSRGIRPDLTTEEMVEIGEEIVEGKGTCLTCHTLGSEKRGRFPDLENIGSRAGKRKRGFSDVEYLAESLYDPNAYIVEGFAPGMPAVNKPPINLSDQEILTVIAFLQSLGATPTVTMQTRLKYAGGTLSASTTSFLSQKSALSDGPSRSDKTENLAGDALFKKYLCYTCHNIDTPKPLVGPSLYDVGKRLTPAQLYEALLEPDATVLEGYPEGVMSATLQGMGFYKDISMEELKTLVEFLSSHKGGE